MDDASPSAAQSPDVKESRPSFKKPASDASRRNYRRHSPLSSRSPTPTPVGGFKRDRSPSQLSQEDGGGQRRERKLDISAIEAGRGSKRGADGATYNEYHSSNRDRYKGRDDRDYYYKNKRHSSHQDRSHHSSHYANSSGRSYHSHVNRREDSRHLNRSDRRSPERSRDMDESRHRRKDSRATERDRGREERTSDTRDRYNRSRDRDGGSSGWDKPGAGKDSDDLDADMENLKEREKGRGKDAGGVYQDDYKGQSRPRDNLDINEEKHASKLDAEKVKVSAKDSSWRKSKEVRKENESDEDDRKVKGRVEKQLKTSRFSPDASKDGEMPIGEKGGGKSSEKLEKRHSQDHHRHCIEEVSSENLSRVTENAASDDTDVFGAPVDEGFLKGTKWGPESEASFSLAGSKGSQAQAEGGSNDVSSATLAAMRAAEAASKSFGNLTSAAADHKKKLLWGHKHQECAAASGTNRWDTVQFADRERQEKFNKLMGVKDVTVEVATGGEKTSGLFTAEKQQELQQDLEKQFTAGLRRRDGRTVGLGL